MNHLTADKVLVDRLAGVMEAVEIRDSGGKVLGRFTPVFSDEQERRQRAEKYFDLAEAERALAEDTNGCSHAEMWERIHAGEGGE